VKNDRKIADLGEADQALLEIKSPDLGVELFEADGVDACLLEGGHPTLLGEEITPSLVKTVEDGSANMTREIIDPFNLGTEGGKLAALFSGGVELLGVAIGPTEAAKALLVGKVPEEATGPLPAFQTLKLGLGRVDPKGEDGMEGHEERNLLENKEVSRA